MEEDNNSFVSNASSRSKSFGHNKFQVQLQEANSKIESLEQTIKDKDDELQLFKDNMRTFHIQLQDKNIELNQLKADVIKYQNNIDTLTYDLNKLSSDKTSDTTNLNERCTILHDENIHLFNTINQLHKHQGEINDKYNDLKMKYQTTLDLLEKKSQEFIVLSSKYDNICNELNLLKELNSKQEKDIDTVKQELFQSKNETSVLKTQLFEKDISLGELHKKLALEEKYLASRVKTIQIQSNQEEEQESTPEDSTNQEQREADILQNRSVKITTQRGVKLSRR